MSHYTKNFQSLLYTCTINCPPQQLLIFGTGTVLVTNPVKVVLVIGIVCVHVRERARARVCVCVCVCACIIIIIINIICVWLGSVIDKVREEWGRVHKSIRVPACWEWENINTYRYCIYIYIYMIFNIHVYKPEWCLTLLRCFITVFLSSCRVYTSAIFLRPCLNVKMSGRLSGRMCIIRSLLFFKFKVILRFCCCCCTVQFS